MRIGSEKDAKLMVLLMAICVLFASCIMYYGGGIPLWYIIMIITPLFVFLIIPYAIITGREIVMDVDGCTICFLCFQRRYAWDELVTKRVEDYGGRVTYRSPYSRAAIFSPKSIKKPRWMKPMEYMMVPFHSPFFFIHFLPLRKDLYSDKLNGWPLVSCIDETLFVSKMKEWNIDILII